ncbi:MAG: zinc ribbon domain-containing protein [Terriglobales bacterium]
MANGNQSSRLRGEFAIISGWVVALAVVAFVAAATLFLVVMGRDHHAPPVGVQWLLAVMAGTVVGCYIVLIGYINRDAGRRAMSRLLWTLIAILVPNGLGIVLYFILRKPRVGRCPQCGAEVQPGFSFCPRCRNRLQPVCPQCQHAVNVGDKFCPYCGGALQTEAGTQSGAAISQ